VVRSGNQNKEGRRQNGIEGVCSRGLPSNAAAHIGIKFDLNGYANSG
jgi:hypothetical protein